MTVDELDNGAGHEGPKSDPPEPLPEPGMAVERSYPTCGAIKRQGGDPCTQKAGWGTDHVGMGKCKLHGGKSLRRHGRYSGITRERMTARATDTAREERM